MYIHMSAYPNILTVMTDPTRAQIVAAIGTGECAVSDIVDRVAIRQSGVSRHLRILHDAGVVSVRPDGQRRLYSLRPEAFIELDQWLDGYRALWSAKLDRFGAALTRNQIKANLIEKDETS